MDTEQRNRLAKSLRDNPLLHEILNELRIQAIRIWETSCDPETQVECWHKVRSIEQIRTYLKNVLIEEGRNGH